MSNHTGISRLRRRATAGAIVLGVALLFGIGVARAGEIIPSVGVTRAVDGNGHATVMGGLAFRSDLMPLVRSEVAVGYRSESRFGDNVRVRQWPITASLYLSPASVVYAGAGVGWYQTTFHSTNLGVSDDTHQDFGVHVGGGFQVPVTPAAAVDLNGRYVMMRDQESRLTPEKFNPDFWTTSLGLSFKF
jgi:opacity protein-like surface antigen